MESEAMEVMCTSGSHSIIEGQCLCGAVRDGFLCWARSPYSNSGPPLWNKDIKGKHIRTNEECLRCEGECAESMYVND